MPELNTLSFGIFASIAQHERELISARTKAALAVVKKTKKLGNPNGWNSGQEKAQISRKESRKNWLVSIESERAKNIIEILFNNGNKNLNEIARNLNFQNIKTQRGGKWQPNQVNNFLSDIGCK
jgi:DNA invertase Pin-like site-specific DNA recombinase